MAEGGYEYIARYVDDVMYFSKNPENIIHYLEDFYTMKGVRYPQFYLGGGDVVEFLTTWNSIMLRLDFRVIPTSRIVWKI